MMVNSLQRLVLHYSLLYARLAGLNNHCSTCQTRVPLTGYCCTVRVCATWERASLKCLVEPATTPFLLRACGMYGSVEALSSREAESEAVGHMTAPGPS
jgi:hypothetical protein